MNRRQTFLREASQHKEELAQMLKDKLKEAVSSVLPIIMIVMVLCFTIAPVSSGIMLEFIIGAVLLVMGMVLFTMGAEMSMTPMGEKVGSSMTKSKKLWVMGVLGFVLGFIITISEPDLQVLAEQVPSVPNIVLILAVAVGVGIFLVVAFCRILFSISLPTMLVVFYAVVFLLAFFTPKSFLAVAFDSGGVTTGPMTVPFIMALGIGISSIRNDKHAADDSFGLVALCSIGPILAVLILGIIYKSDGGYYALGTITEVEDSIELGRIFLEALPEYMIEIAGSLLPIVVAFGIFQVFLLKLSKKNLIKILVGLIYTYLGLVLFLTGVNVGFMPAGNYLGQIIASLPYRWIIIPIGMVIGYFIVMAEPAVHVLTKQVEEVTDGVISGSLIRTGLSISVAVSVGLAMFRVLTGSSILYLLIPGYGVAILLSFFVPKIFTAIAFDSGGVASGPMTATFLLPFAIGACMSVGGDIVSDAFGVVAMVAMTPLITIQVIGLIFKLQEKKSLGEKTAEAVPGLDMYEDDSIIDL